MATLDFRRGAVQPMECVKQGWALIKDQIWLFVGISLVALLIMQVASFILVGPMMCGLFLCYFRKMDGEPVEFGLLFKGFDYFGPSFIATLIQMGIIFAVIGLPMMLIVFAMLGFGMFSANRGDGPPSFSVVETGGVVVIALLMLVMMLVGMVIQALFLFTFQLLTEHRNLSGWEAVKTSASAARGNMGGVIGLMLLNFLLTLGGMLLCYVGVFLVLPVMFASYAIAYRQVFPRAYGGPAAV